MSGPNLSQYFATDSPSMFDEIATNTIENGLSQHICRTDSRRQFSSNICWPTQFLPKFFTVTVTGGAAITTTPDSTAHLFSHVLSKVGHHFMWLFAHFSNVEWTISVRQFADCTRWDIGEGWSAWYVETSVHGTWFAATVDNAWRTTLHWFGTKMEAEAMSVTVWLIFNFHCFIDRRIQSERLWCICWANLKRTSVKSWRLMMSHKMNAAYGNSSNWDAFDRQ